MLYVFSYFKKDDEKLFLAASEDGYEWSDLFGGAAVHASGVGTGAIRDPFLLEDADGWFHLLWTDGWSSRSIGYACSRNLAVWEDERLIPVMEHLPATQNCWAPEAFFDEDTGAYRILWSSTVGDEPRNHRIWSVVTEDFAVFSPAGLFFDPGYNVIDATVAGADGEYFMLYKDERGTNEPGTPFKAIRSCRFARNGGDRPETYAESELITPALTEGPALYPVWEGGRRRWILLFDGFREQYYGAYRSDDLSTWEDVGDAMRLPKGARHGAVLVRRGKEGASW